MKQTDRNNFQVPSILQLPLELLGIVDAARLLLDLPKLSNAPRGNGEKIIVLPGYATDDNYTYLLRMYLNSLGYNSEGWGLGNNHGNVLALYAEVDVIVKKIYEQEQKKIILIGWSLGGYIAREVARDNQDKIERVITLASPIIGGPKYTSFAQTSDTKKASMDEIEKRIEKRYENPINLPLFSIYSKRDNIVSWNACIDHYSPNVIHQEVNSTHIGFMANPEVYFYIGKFLQLNMT